MVRSKCGAEQMWCEENVVGEQTGGTNEWCEAEGFDVIGVNTKMVVDGKGKW